MDTEKKPAKERLKETWEKTKAAVGKVAGKVSKLVWIIIAAVLVAIVIGIVIFLNTRPYSILVTGASPSEVSTVTTWLEGRGVTDYRVQGTGTVLVPDRQAAVLKAALLTEQYADGSNYDFSGYFDNVSMLSTESERNNAWWIAVQEKMAAVITQMEGVEWASVSITPGEDRGYVLDKNNVVNATASVTVRTRDGKVLDDGVAQAIRGYVAHGVQGLNVEDVALYDTNGNPYNESLVKAEGGSFDTSLLKLQLEQQYQNQKRAEVMNILSPLFGEGHVNCAISIEIELNTTEINENEPYIPDYIDEEHRGSGEGIIGQKYGDYIFITDGENVVGGLVGSEPNSDVSTYVEEGVTPEDFEDRVQGEWQKDYNNPVRETHTYRTAGYITDAHVAVTVDSTTAKELNIENLRNTIANAVGISAIETETQTAAEYLASKVSIYAGPFYQEMPAEPDPFGWWPFDDIIPGEYLVLGLAALVLLIILIVVIVLLAKRHKKKKEAARALAEEEAQRAALEEAEVERQAAEAALAEAMGMPQTELVGADVMSLQTEKSMELRQDIRQFVEENPEVAAQLLKTWLRGGDDRG